MQFLDKIRLRAQENAGDSELMRYQMEQKKEQRHTLTSDFSEGVNRNTEKKKSIGREGVGKDAFGKCRELRGSVLQFIFNILCKRTAQSILKSLSLGNLTVASSC